MFYIIYVNGVLGHGGGAEQYRTNKNVAYGSVKTTLNLGTETAVHGQLHTKSEYRDCCS